MIVVGLTGSIGMGKTTTAGLFAEAGVPVWDADAAVHRLYAAGGAAVEGIAEVFPEVVVEGAVDRVRLGRRVHDDPSAFARLEAIVHPLTAKDRQAFLETAAKTGAPLVVLDIPLLFETGADAALDAVVVVSAPDPVQRARVLARPGMDAQRFEGLLARQVPDAQKRGRADFVIDTDQGLDFARHQVAEVLRTLAEKDFRSRRGRLDAAGEAPQ